MHNRLIFLFVFMSFTVTTFSQGNIEVKVTNLKSSGGFVRIGLFNNEKGFLKDAVEGKVVGVKGDEVTATFENLKPGDYAISVIHDENDNGELDTNFMGIPKEGFGFGNNAMGAFGPPSFDKAKVTVGTETIKQEIKVKYF